MRRHHHQGAGDRLARHVAEDDGAIAVLSGRQLGVEIAADVTRGAADRRHRPAGSEMEDARQQLRLHARSDLELALELRLPGALGDQPAGLERQRRLPEEVSEERPYFVADLDLPGRAGEQDETDLAPRRGQVADDLHSGRLQPGHQLANLFGAGHQARQLGERHRLPFRRQGVVERREQRQARRQLLRAGGALEGALLLEVERREVQPENLRQALDDVAHDRLRIELGGHGAAELADRLLQPPAIRVHEGVDHPLDTVAQRLEQQQDAEREEDRKGRRRGELRTQGESVHQRQRHRVHRGDADRDDRVDEAAPHHDADVEQAEADDGESEGQRHQRQRTEERERLRFGVQPGRSCDRQGEERQQAEERAREDQRDAAPLPRVVGLACVPGQGREADQHVQSEHPPTRLRGTGDQPGLDPRPLPEHESGDEDGEGQQIERDEQRQPAPASTDEIGVARGRTQGNRTREDEEEVQETGREEQQRHGPGLEHQAVDPAIGGRAQPADQEEQEERADEMEDLRGAQLRLAAQDEESDDEEGETEEAGEEVGRAADETAPETDAADLFDPLPAPQEVGHLVADLAPREDPAGVGTRLEQGAVDADDPVGRQDPGQIGAGAGHDLADRERAPLVGLEDDAVIGPRDEDVDDRQHGEGERQHAEYRHHPRKCPAPHSGIPSGLLYVQRAWRIWRMPVARRPRLPCASAAPSGPIRLLRPHPTAPDPIQSPA